MWKNGVSYSWSFITSFIWSNYTLSNGHLSQIVFDLIVHFQIWKDTV